MNEHNDDLRHAKRFLLMDDREWANALAEQQKHAGRGVYRRIAIQRGDLGSPLTASFVAIDGTKWCTAQAAMEWSDEVRKEEAREKAAEAKRAGWILTALACGTVALAAFVYLWKSGAI